MILLRLHSFKVELQQKTCDTGFTVNETRFICERAILLIKDCYCRGVCQSLKEQTIARLEEAIDQAALYYACYNVKSRTSNIAFAQVVQKAYEAIDFFLKNTHPVVPYGTIPPKQKYKRLPTKLMALK